MDAKKLASLLECLDGTGSSREYKAIRLLKEKDDELPQHLLERYRASRQWKARAACAFHAVFYARSSEVAVTLGREAIQDKARVVRYRASGLLAYSLRKDVLPDLREAARALRDKPGIEDLHAAIDAIEHQNHHYFIDREHSGRMTWDVEEATRAQ